LRKVDTTERFSIDNLLSPIVNILAGAVPTNSSPQFCFLFALQFVVSPLFQGAQRWQCSGSDQSDKEHENMSFSCSEIESGEVRVV
jgi:hypothetical protein